MADEFLGLSNLKMEREVRDGIRDERNHQAILKELSALSDHPNTIESDKKLCILIRLWLTLENSPKRTKYLEETFYTLMRKTTLSILTPHWCKIEDSLKEELFGHVIYCGKLLNNTIEGCLEKCHRLKELGSDPWSNRFVEWEPLLAGHLPLDDYKVQAYLANEPEDIALARVHFLIIIGCEDQASCLVKYSLKYRSVPCSYQYQKRLKKDFEKEKGRFFSSLEWFVFLLQRKKTLPEIVRVTDGLSCHEGLLVIQALRKKPETRDLADFLIQVFLVHEIVEPRAYCCTKELFKLWCIRLKEKKMTLSQVTEASRHLFGRYAPTSAHFYLLVDTLWEQFGQPFLLLYSELFIRGFTTDINHLEVARSFSMKAEMVELEIHLARMFTKLSILFSDSHEIVARECVLSAFSLRPNKERLLILQTLTHSILSNQSENNNWNFDGDLVPESLRMQSGANCFECGGSCSKDCQSYLQRTRTFHPLLMKGICNIPYSLVIDLVVVLEAVRANVFKFNFHEWRNVATDLNDYLNMFRMHESAQSNRLIRQPLLKVERCIESDTDVENEEINSEDSNSRLQSVNMDLNAINRSMKYSGPKLNTSHCVSNSERDLGWLPSSNLTYLSNSAPKFKMQTDGRSYMRTDMPYRYGTSKPKDKNRGPPILDLACKPTADNNTDSFASDTALSALPPNLDYKGRVTTTESGKVHTPVCKQKVQKMTHNPLKKDFITCNMLPALNLQSHSSPTIKQHGAYDKSFIHLNHPNTPLLQKNMKKKLCNTPVQSNGSTSATVPEITSTNEQVGAYNPEKRLRLSEDIMDKNSVSTKASQNALGTEQHGSSLEGLGSPEHYFGTCDKKHKDAKAKSYSVTSFQNISSDMDYSSDSTCSNFNSSITIPTTSTVQSPVCKKLILSSAKSLPLKSDSSYAAFIVCTKHCDSHAHNAPHSTVPEEHMQSSHLSHDVSVLSTPIVSSSALLSNSSASNSPDMFASSSEHPVRCNSAPLSQNSEKSGVSSDRSSVIQHTTHLHQSSGDQQVSTETSSAALLPRIPVSINRVTSTMQPFSKPANKQYSIPAIKINVLPSAKKIAGNGLVPANLVIPYNRQQNGTVEAQLQAGEKTSTDSAKKMITIPGVVVLKRKCTSGNSDQSSSPTSTKSTWTTLRSKHGKVDCLKTETQTSSTPPTLVYKVPCQSSTQVTATSTTVSSACINSSHLSGNSNVSELSIPGTGNEPTWSSSVQDIATHNQKQLLHICNQNNESTSCPEVRDWEATSHCHETPADLAPQYCDPDSNLETFQTSERMQSPAPPKLEKCVTTVNNYDSHVFSPPVTTNITQNSSPLFQKIKTSEEYLQKPCLAASLSSVSHAETINTSMPNIINSTHSIIKNTPSVSTPYCKSYSTNAAQGSIQNYSDQTLPNVNASFSETQVQPDVKPFQRLPSVKPLQLSSPESSKVSIDWSTHTSPKLSSCSTLTRKICCSPHEPQPCQNCCPSIKNSDIQVPPFSTAAILQSPTPTDSPLSVSRDTSAGVHNSSPSYAAGSVVHCDSLGKKERKKPLFQCPACGKLLCTKYTLKTHIQKFHSGIPPKRKGRKAGHFYKNTGEFVPSRETTGSSKNFSGGVPELHSESKSIKTEHSDDLDEYYSPSTSDNREFDEKIFKYFADLVNQPVAAEQKKHVINPINNGEASVNMLQNSVQISDPCAFDEKLYSSTNQSDFTEKFIDQELNKVAVQNNRVSQHASELQSSWQVAGTAMRYLNDPTCVDDADMFSEFPTPSLDSLAEEGDPCFYDDRTEVMGRASYSLNETSSSVPNSANVNAEYSKPLCSKSATNPLLPAEAGTPQLLESYVDNKALENNTDRKADHVGFPLYGNSLLSSPITSVSTPEESVLFRDQNADFDVLSPVASSGDYSNELMGKLNDDCNLDCSFKKPFSNIEFSKEYDDCISAENLLESASLFPDQPNSLTLNEAEPDNSGREFKSCVATEDTVISMCATKPKKNKQATCDICNKKLCSTDSKKRHMKNVHKIPIPERQIRNIPPKIDAAVSSVEIKIESDQAGASTLQIVKEGSIDAASSCNLPVLLPATASNSEAVSLHNTKESKQYCSQLHDAKLHENGTEHVSSTPSESLDIKSSASNAIVNVSPFIDEFGKGLLQVKEEVIPQIIPDFQSSLPEGENTFSKCRKLSVKCSVCGKLFCSTASQKRHLRNVHKCVTDELKAQEKKRECEEDFLEKVQKIIQTINEKTQSAEEKNKNMKVLSAGQSPCLNNMELDARLQQYQDSHGLVTSDASVGNTVLGVGTTFQKESCTSQMSYVSSSVVPVTSSLVNISSASLTSSLDTVKCRPPDSDDCSTQLLRKYLRAPTKSGSRGSLSNVRTFVPAVKKNHNLHFNSHSYLSSATVDCRTSIPSKTNKNIASSTKDATAVSFGSHMQNFQNEKSTCESNIQSDFKEAASVCVKPTLSEDEEHRLSPPPLVPIIPPPLSPSHIEKTFSDSNCINNCIRDKNSFDEINQNVDSKTVHSVFENTVRSKSKCCSEGSLPPCQENEQMLLKNVAVHNSSDASERQVVQNSVSVGSSMQDNGARNITQTPICDISALPLSSSSTIDSENSVLPNKDSSIPVLSPVHITPSICETANQLNLNTVDATSSIPNNDVNSRNKVLEFESNAVFASSTSVNVCKFQKPCVESESTFAKCTLEEDHKKVSVSSSSDAVSSEDCYQNPFPVVPLISASSDTSVDPKDVTRVPCEQEYMKSSVNSFGNTQESVIFTVPNCVKSIITMDLKNNNIGDASVISTPVQNQEECPNTITVQKVTVNNLKSAVSSANLKPDISSSRANRKRNTSKSTTSVNQCSVGDNTVSVAPLLKNDVVKSNSNKEYTSIKKVSVTDTKPKVKLVRLDHALVSDSAPKDKASGIDVTNCSRQKTSIHPQNVVSATKILQIRSRTNMRSKSVTHLEPSKQCRSASTQNIRHRTRSSSSDGMCADKSKLKKSATKSRPEVEQKVKNEKYVSLTESQVEMGKSDSTPVEELSDSVSNLPERNHKTKRKHGRKVAEDKSFDSTQKEVNFPKLVLKKVPAVDSSVNEVEYYVPVNSKSLHRRTQSETIQNKTDCKSKRIPTRSCVVKINKLDIERENIPLFARKCEEKSTRESKIVKSEISVTRKSKLNSKIEQKKQIDCSLVETENSAHSPLTQNKMPSCKVLVQKLSSRQSISSTEEHTRPSRTCRRRTPRFQDEITEIAVIPRNRRKRLVSRDFDWAHSDPISEDSASLSPICITLDSD